MSGSDSIRNVLLRAMTAARNGIPPSAPVALAIMTKGSDLRVAGLGFDSLAMMEFCISIELQTGAELTPDVIEGLATMDDIADWVQGWRGRGV